jgi:hypothetical protein
MWARDRILTQFASRHEVIIFNHDRSRRHVEICAAFCAKGPGKGGGTAFPEKASRGVAGDSMHQFSEPRRALRNEARQRKAVSWSFRDRPVKLLGAMITGGEKFQGTGSFPEARRACERLAEVGLSVFYRGMTENAIIARAGAV